MPPDILRAKWRELCRLTILKQLGAFVNTRGYVMEGEKLTMKVEEAAHLLGISRGLAYEMARTGKLPTIRFGRRLLVPRRALYRLLDGSKDVEGERDGKE